MCYPFEREPIHLKYIFNYFLTSIFLIKELIENHLFYIELCFLVWLNLMFQIIMCCVWCFFYFNHLKLNIIYETDVWYTLLWDTALNKGNTYLSLIRSVSYLNVVKHMHPFKELPEQIVLQGLIHPKVDLSLCVHTCPCE